MEQLVMQKYTSWRQTKWSLLIPMNERSDSTSYNSTHYTTGNIIYTAKHRNHAVHATEQDNVPDAKLKFSNAHIGNINAISCQLDSCRQNNCQLVPEPIRQTRPKPNFFFKPIRQLFAGVRPQAWQLELTKSFSSTPFCTCISLFQ